MFKRFLFLVVAAFLTTAVFADGVDIEYDKSIKPGKYKTFAFVDSEKTSLSSSNPEMHERAAANIRVMMIRSGIREVKNNPALHVTYHAASGKDLNINVSDYGYEYPRFYMRTGLSAPNTQATYDQGAIIVDVYDTETNEIVWRGIAWKVLSKDPAKRGKQLDKAMEEMWRKWASIKSKAAKAQAKAAAQK